MYRKNKLAFTFVELIVVITILAILASIGFGTYQTYLGSGRDANRIIQLNDISDGLERMSINSRLPFPEQIVEVQANGNTFAYQGFAGENVIKSIGYDGGGKDIEYGTYLTYMLGTNGRDFQLMTYISDVSLLSFYSGDTFANQNYTGLYPKVSGSQLGVLVDKPSLSPIQELTGVRESGSYDIITGTGEVISYFTDTQMLDSSKGDDISVMIPNKSCFRIHQLGRSIGNGIYTISVDGTTNIRVYCDMQTEGGGWTLVARSVDGAGSGNFGWTVSRGDIKNLDEPYSLGRISESISYDQVLLTGYQGDFMISDYMFIYDINVADFFSSSSTYTPLNCENVLGDGPCPMPRMGHYECTDYYFFHPVGSSSCARGLRAGQQYQTSVEAGIDGSQSLIYVR